MAPNDPTLRPDHRPGDDPWHPRAHALGDRDKADPTESPAIAISRELHDSLCITLTLFKEFAEKTSARLCADLPKLQEALTIASDPSTADKGELLNQTLTFQIARDSRLLSKILLVLGSLDTLLKDESLVSDPGLRRFGEICVQLPLNTLRVLSQDDDISTLGSATPVNRFEHRDHSLKELFAVHAEEIRRLSRMPT
jgi:hypothetical protein